MTPGRRAVKFMPNIGQHEINNNTYMSVDPTWWEKDVGYTFGYTEEEEEERNSRTSKHDSDEPK